MADGLVELAALFEDIGQIVVRDPSTGIFLQGIAPQGLQIGIDLPLPPSEQTADGQDQRQCDWSGRRLAQPRPHAVPTGGGQCQKPQTGQVLEVVGDKGIEHGVEVEKAEGRR